MSRGWRRLGLISHWLVQPRRVVLMLALALAMAVIWGRDDRSPDSQPPSLVLTSSLHHVDPEVVLSMVQRHFGSRFHRVDLQSLQQQLEGLNWVESAMIRRAWPRQVLITIQERQPIAIWNDRLLVDRRGQLFDPGRSLGMGGGLPRLEGPQDSRRQALLRYLGLSQRLSGHGLAIAELHLDERHAVDLALDNGIHLRLGREQLDTRLELFLKAWQSGLASRAGQMQSVDLRYPNGLAVRLAEDGRRRLGQAER